MNTVFLKTPDSTQVQGRFPTRLTKMFAANAPANVTYGR